MKAESRKPKAERIPKAEIRKSSHQGVLCTDAGDPGFDPRPVFIRGFVFGFIRGFGFGLTRASGFGFLSDFGLRISGLTL